MEQKNIKPEQTTARWINCGWAVVGEKAKLNTLKQGQYFLKDHLICFVNITSPRYISYFDLIMREHSTSDTEQLVNVVNLVGEKK